MTTETDELRTGIQRLHDIEAARSFSYRYATVLNTPDPSTVSALFDPAGELIVPGSSYAGRDAIAGFFAAAFARDPSLKRHFICNTRVLAVTERQVTLASEFLYVGRGDTSVIGWGDYQDVVDVSGDEPCFVRKTIGIGVATDLARGWAR